MKLFLVFAFLLCFSSAHAQALTGVIIEKYANVRNAPSVTNSTIITKVFKGSAVKILDKTTEKIKIGELEGHWYKIELLENGEEGWVFDKYVALEGDSRIQEFIQFVTSSLYYYRPNLDEQLKEIKRVVSQKNAFEELKKYNPRFLNYIGYHLIAEKNAMAFPVLITFMNPDFKEENSKDANYLFTWELLERLTPKVLITSNFKSFEYWWHKNYDSAVIDLPPHEIALIFKKIQDNENKVYRKLIE
ncbi:MAG: SH3 domain-containing protein [Deltaproteobacteria bacterium]|nr:SH3 domain-containing protein [Deltaproteobacteria bacterium]